MPIMFNLTTTLPRKANTSPRQCSPGFHRDSELARPTTTPTYLNPRIVPQTHISSLLVPRRTMGSTRDAFRLIRSFHFVCWYGYFTLSL